jgi:hypothetical protein
MGFWDWFKKGPKSVLDLSREELRKEEMVTTRDRNRLMKRIDGLSADKQSLFARGAKERSPEIRRALAQEFELRTREQELIGRELNLKSKELLTLGRVRMLREAAGREGSTILSRMREGEMARLMAMMGDDAVNARVYEDRLNEILTASEDAMAEADELTGTGKEVMAIWEKMDAGSIDDEQKAFAEADRRTRRDREAEMEEY